MGLSGSVTARSAQGARMQQEDRHVVHRFELPGPLSGQLLAVLDGHGGSEAADACAEAIPRLFSLQGPDDGLDALRRLVATLDERTRGMRSGTTASLACILESHSLAAVAVLGDSPVLAVDRGRRYVLSPHHNVRTNLEERSAGEDRGGLYERGYLVNPATGVGLQMARALGDRGMGGILSREPDVYTVELGPESFVLLATDGLMDPADPRMGRVVGEILSLWRGRAPFDAAALLAWAERRELWDNATAVVWQAAARASGQAA